MTTSVFPLDRDQVTAVEPSETSGHGKTWLSPYAIPRSVRLRYGEGVGSLLGFGYHGEEEPANPAVPLDGNTEVPILVTTAASTRKVLSLATTVPLTPLDFAGIADRLDAAAGRPDRPTERLSYRLTAAALRIIAQGMMGVGWGGGKSAGPDPGRN